MIDPSLLTKKQYDNAKFRIKQYPSSDYEAWSQDDLDNYAYFEALIKQYEELNGLRGGKRKRTKRKRTKRRKSRK